MRARGTHPAALALTVALAAAAGATAASGQEAQPLAPLEAAAEPLPVAVETRFGFGRQLIPREGFVPVTVRLTSTEPVGEAQVHVRSVEQEAELFSLGPVTLEAGVTRQVTGTVAVRTLLEAGPLVVLCRTPAGEVIGEAEVSPDETSSRILLVLDQRGALSTDLGALEEAEGGGAGWKVLPLTRVEELPQTPLAYSGVTAVLLGELEVERWSPAQAAALAGWVTRGGHLLLSLGGRAPVLKRSQLGRALKAGLAPVPFDGAPIAGDAVRLTRLLANYSALTDRELAGNEDWRPPFLTRLHPGPQDVVRHRADPVVDVGAPVERGEEARDGRPVVVQRRHGEGLLTLIGCDLWAPPFVHTVYSGRLLRDLLGTWGGSLASRSDVLFDELKEVRQPAQVGGAFALLVVYALLAGPVAYFVLRAKRRGILVWVVIPALTLAFSASIPLYRLSLRDAESILVGVRLVEARAEAEEALETVDVLLFSGSLEAKRVLLPGADATAHTVIPPRRALRRRGDPRPRPDRVLGVPDGTQLQFELPVALWGSRYVSMARTWKGRPVKGEVRLASGSGVGVRARLSLEYSGGVELQEPVLVYPGRGGPMAASLGRALAPGARWSGEVELGAPCASFAVKDSTLAPLVLQRLVNGAYGERVGTHRAFLLATTEEPPPLKARPNVRTRAFGTVVAVELPVVFEGVVPPGALRHTVRTSTVARVDSQTVVRDHVTRLTLPHPPVAALAAAEVTLHPGRGRDVRGLALAARVFGAGEAEVEWQELPLEQVRVERLAGSATQYRLDLLQPERFLSPSGSLELRQRFTRPVADGDGPHVVPLSVRLAWEGSGASLRPEDAPDELLPDLDVGEGR